MLSPTFRVKTNNPGPSLANWQEIQKCLSFSFIIPENKSKLQPKTIYYCIKFNREGCNNLFAAIKELCRTLSVRLKSEDAR